MADDTESVYVDVPTGERISATVPRGTPDAAIGMMLRSKHPELFHTGAPASESQAAAMPPLAPQMSSSQMQGAASQNPNDAFSKATGIGRGPSVLDRLRAGQVPGLDELQQGFQSAGNPTLGTTGLATQPSFIGRAGQMAGVLLKNPAAQALGAAIVPTPGAGAAADVTKEWQAINEAIHATKTSVKIPKSAMTIQDAVTMPARGLQSEGLNAKVLSKMSPIEQQAVIAPKWNAAGKAVDQAAIQATGQGIFLNPSKSALDVAGSIQNPALQEKAVKQLSDLMKEIGIQDASQTTPLEALQLRRALRSGARFGPNGDLSSLGGIRAQLYSAVSKDLSDAIPGFSQIDQHYADLNSAIKAINNAAASSATKAPPTFLEKFGPDIVKGLAKGAGIGGAAAAGGTLYEIWKHLH